VPWKGQARSALSTTYVYVGCSSAWALGVVWIGPHLLSGLKEFLGFFLSSRKDIAFDSINQTFKTSLLGQGLQTEIPGNEKGISTKALYNLVD